MIILVLDDASNILANGVGEWSENTIKSTLAVTAYGEADRFYILDSRGNWHFQGLINNSRRTYAECTIDSPYLQKDTELVWNLNLRVNSC